MENLSSKVNKCVKWLYANEDRISVYSKMTAQNSSGSQARQEQKHIFYQEKPFTVILCYYLNREIFSYDITGARRIYGKQLSSYNVVVFK